MSTPPPNQNPYAPQGGASYGQQQPGPYSQQPQAPYGQQAPGPYGQPGGFPTAPVPPPAPKRSFKKIFRNIVVPIAGLTVIAGGWLFSKSDDTTKLAVGDCLQNSGTNDKPNVKKRDCTDSKATFKVLKKVDGSTLYTLACQDVEERTAALTWKERSDSFTLCLGDNKK
ncbi:LppU/SCO3897 family protein [Streptomyces cinnamoneus]|uniref:LppU/SCO3897 family protein n=1 Tax=Streptomyces cinnamoneus TaxID=53446 RepID=UPI003797E5F7